MASKHDQGDSIHSHATRLLDALDAINPAFPLAPGKVLEIKELKQILRTAMSKAHTASGNASKGNSMAQPASESRAPGIGDMVKIKRTGKFAKVVSTSLGNIQYKSNSVDGSVMQDCWNDFIELTSFQAGIRHK